MDSDNNPKSRGLDKFKKNKRGHGKAKPIPRQNALAAKSKPSLESNWDRYETEEVQQTLDSSTDFALLANAPISQGNHFRFKSDKDFAGEIDVKNQKPLDLFNLDLNILNRSLSTIPFNVRSSIEDRYFSDSQRIVMQTGACRNRDEYNSYLKDCNLLSSDSQGDAQSLLIFGQSGVMDSDSDNDCEEEIERGRDEVDVVEAADNKTLDEEHKSNQRFCKTKNEESDLEQWLDDVLDD